MRALICGYYGEHNLGDDALLAVLLDQLPANCLPVVTAHDQALVRKQFGVETTDRRRLGAVLAALGRCQALVLGGGSLLQDSTSFQSLLYYGALMLAARVRGQPVILWGQGLGPLRRRRSRALVRGLLPLATAISWRDAASAGQARAWGVEAPVGSDPVWALSAQRWSGHGGPIVLCFRPVHQLSGAAWSPYLQALEHLALAADREVLWLPFHQDQDRGLLASLLRQGLVGEALARRSRELLVQTPAQAMEAFRQAGLVLAMRLHGLILAALAGSPCAALSYDPKVAAAAAGIGCPCQELEAPPPESLQATWATALDTPPDSSGIAALQRDSQVHRGVLAALDV
ncbi:MULTISPECIES: polysaccharide pyruvyl transferase CsaB [unclassified Cyanobium]|uniref:polysaccharide pyruvyl transferase CsaB n=1 Tax=unclassified Cyanobium TaxID=2627006 RepID=UPI0020CFB710|nr:MULTISPECIES: polysaccharide pyruvyl transferase CsaB [unclassified Cyanobium]MCP9833212.1 polysaccharide pyruvyl transferase CsaB [Cyanobium sp. La Preciosa 7G6]MCP9935925.1 polysaccharide pyruvyl transferase CsaB [Cyanobium sp. Aljojuca 7A6]